MSAANIAAAERDHGAGLFNPREIAFEFGKGAELFTAEGKRYLDAAAAFGVASLGHGDPELSQTVAHQAARQIACTPSFANAERAAYLTELAAALPGDLQRIFLCNSGTESIEAALKFARLTNPDRPGLIACVRAFHGRSMGALSATWEKRYREPFGALVPGTVHVPYNRIEAIESAIDAAQENAANDSNPPIGAIIIEIILGEGGVRPATDSYLQALERLCHERDILLIVDEVQTGFGRTGKLFAVEHAAIVPDILCLAKGIAGGVPMGATAFGPRVAKLQPGLHGSTFGGNPLACAAARVVLRRLQAGLTDSANQVGTQLIKQLRSLDFPVIREVRGRGLMIGMEFKQPVGPLLAELLDRGIVALSAGPRVLRLLPPLVLTNEQASELVQAIALAIQSTNPAYAAS